MMLRSLSIAALLGASLIPAGGMAQVSGAVYYSGNQAHIQRVYYHRYRRRERHPVRKTIKRVGLGAAGGAAVGAVIGGGPGAAVGAVAGGVAGEIYNHHEKHIGK